MSDYEARLGNRNKNIINLSSALSLELGIPTDTIEQALRKITSERNNVNDHLSLPNVPNSIQDCKLVDGLSQSTQSTSLIDTDSEPISQTSKSNRKDSLSSLIEITQSGSTSINIKLPDLYTPPPTAQEDSLALAGTTASSSIDGNRSSVLYSDEPDIYNNEDLMLQPQHAKQNQNIYKSSSFSNEEFIQPRRKSLDVQNSPTSFPASGDSGEFIHPPFMPDPDDIQSKRRESLDLHAKQDRDPFNSFSDEKPKKNKPSETYSSEWPSLSEATKKGDQKKNSEVELGAWGPMNINIASAWGKPKKWSSDTEAKPFEPPAPTWNPDDVNHLTWEPIQEPKAPIFRKKKNVPVNFELDDNEGWGAPPTKYIPWDDSRQGYCVDLIEEQKETVFWTMQNGDWVNVTEETKKTLERTSNGVTRTQTKTQRTERHGTDSKLDGHQRTERQVIDNKSDGRQRTERQRTDNILDGRGWDAIREQTRRERLGITTPDNETDVISNNEEIQGDSSILIELTSDSNNSEIEDAQSNYVEGPRERLGNPQWKTEKEWRGYNSHSKQEELMKSNTDLSDSKSSEDDEEPLTSASDRDESAGEISNWDKTGSGFDNYPVNNMSIEGSAEAILDIEPVKDDAWFIEDVRERERERQEEMIKESEQNPLLINIEDDTTDATIINTHPPIYHGIINNSMADLNDFIVDSANISTNVNIMNDSELNLLSFDDEEDNNVLNSSGDIISVENEKKRCSSNFHELEIFLADNVVTSNTEVPPLDDNKFEAGQSEARPSEVIDELQRKSPSPTLPKSYRDNENKEPLAAADLDSNPTNAVTENNYFVNITVETTGYGKQELRLRYEDNPEAVVAEFCDKWDMKDWEDTLKALVGKERKIRIRKRNKRLKNAKCILNEE